MATLPDIDRGSTGFMAFYNVIDDGGAGAVQPEEALTAPDLLDYTLYDNGWEGRYSPRIGDRRSGDSESTVKVRMKTDGWVVAYMDRTNRFGNASNYTGGLDGYYDLCDGWNDNYQFSFVENTLDVTINSLISELGNSGNISYSNGDAGLYNWEYENSTAVTGLVSDYGQDNDGIYGFLYTGSTSVDYASITSYCWDTSGDSASVSFEGQTIGTVGDTVAQDMKVQGYIPESDTEYRMETQAQEYAAAQGAVMLIWS